MLENNSIEIKNRGSIVLDNDLIDNAFLSYKNRMDELEEQASNSGNSHFTEWQIVAGLSFTSQHPWGKFSYLDDAVVIAYLSNDTESQFYPNERALILEIEYLVRSAL